MANKFFFYAAAGGAFAFLMLARLVYGQNTPVAVCYVAYRDNPDNTDWYSDVFSSYNGLAVHVYEQPFLQWVQRTYNVPSNHVNAHCVAFNSSTTAARQRALWMDGDKAAKIRVVETGWPKP